jgi:NAD(P)H-flavin reductase
MSLLGALGTLSFLYLRQHLYEWFLKSHLIFALGLAGLLWYHIPLGYHQSTICLTLASALWLIQENFWIVRLGYRNIGSQRSSIVNTMVYPALEGSSEVMSLIIKLKRPWTSHPGQHFYITIPRVSRHTGGFAQAHPYMIAWSEAANITIFVQRRNGFSNDIFTSPNLASASIVVDGPYGHPQPLESYDKVLFMASGIGIVAHLLAIKGLLEAHENQSARVRRITLLWFLETPGKILIFFIPLNTHAGVDQKACVSQFLRQLLDIDSDQRHVFTLALYSPSQQAAQGSKRFDSPRCFRTDQSPNLGWFIDQEASSEAGNMAISYPVSHLSM